jgi:hypothetical protein
MRTLSREMDAVQALLRKPSNADSLALTIFGFAILYALLWGFKLSILVGMAFVMMMLGALPQQVALAFLVGATVTVLLQPSRKTTLSAFEGFEDVDPSGSSTDQPDDSSTDETKEQDTEAFSSKPLLPDNTDRKEPLVLGKAYTLPKEADDAGFHLDAGTTFLNAYKAMKPDQIAAMTRDTQELLATQKSLVSMLDSFAPLMKDMGKITGFLGSK